MLMARPIGPPATSAGTGHIRAGGRWLLRVHVGAENHVGIGQADERDPGAGRASRARGRFTRNFVVQASAADWALVLLAALRRRLAALGEAPAGAWRPQAPHLVFFQHDEVLVHCPEAMAPDVVAAVDESAAEAGRAVFGVTQVRFPMTTAVVGCYADAK